jgi:hypothetical protein
MRGVREGWHMVAPMCFHPWVSLQDIKKYLRGDTLETCPSGGLRVDKTGISLA